MSYKAIKFKINVKQIMYSIFFCVFILWASCTSLQKNKKDITPVTKVVNPQDIELFQEAFKNLGEKNYSLVIPVFKKIAKTYRGMDLERAALYNLASAYKELNQCEKAKNIYHTLIAKTKTQSHLKARIFLSLSYSYECMGQFEKSLIALKDGIQFIPHLEKDMRLIEYPARLSLAYMRLNEIKTGLQIQKTIYKNMEFIKNTLPTHQKTDERFARYFYIIGRSHIRTQSINLKLFLKMYSYYQVYLTQSIILKAGKWSVEAEKELIFLYNKMLVSVKKQKNKTQYQAAIKSILNQLKSISRSSKNKNIYNIYLTFRKKINKIFRTQ